LKIGVVKIFAGMFVRIRLNSGHEVSKVLSQPFLVRARFV